MLLLKKHETGKQPITSLILMSYSFQRYILKMTAIVATPMTTLPFLQPTALRITTGTTPATRGAFTIAPKAVTPATKPATISAT